jgi:hypothetical protein
VAANTNRGRRARLRCRTLTRWLWYFEDTKISPDETLLRAIPNTPDFYDKNMGEWQVDPYAFKPNKKRDADGMSFYREDFSTPERVSNDNRHSAGARVARITVKQLINLGLLDIIPDPHQEKDRPAGHVYVPGMRYVDPKSLSKEERQERERISAKLAEHATENVVYSPPNMPDPVRV